MKTMSEATLATPQMPIRRGLKLFGSEGISAVKVELQQLHNLNVTEVRQPLQVKSHLEMPRILVQLGHIQRT